jgi:phospholipid/cholesterol/gamma-HCH transport system substrate-binding protein
MKLLTHNHKLLGLVFLALVLAGIYGTYGIFSKKFVSYDEVTLQTSTIGLQLPSRADVKVRGVIVGEVIAFDTVADGAKLTLGIFPDQIDTIPNNVTGSIVPKTLFGEKYVSLEVPEGQSTNAVPHIQPGATIKRTDVSIEVEKVLSDLYPLLRTVQPAQINSTLNAISTALEGRGERIGENLVTVDGYLKRLNPQIPGLVEDLRLTAQVSQTYSEVLPEVGEILRNTVKTTGTLEGREAKLTTLFNDVAAFSDTTKTFLDDNGDNLIRLSKVSAQQLAVLAKYSPEYPCLIGGIVNAGKLQAEAFRNFTLHIVLETLPNQPRGYHRQDRPRLADDRGPNCLTLPTPPGSQANPTQNLPNFNDGVDEPTGKGTDRVAPSYYRTDRAGSPEESALLKSLLSPGLGTTDAEVPDLGPLLLGPMARGARVSMQ